MRDTWIPPASGLMTRRRRCPIVTQSSVGLHHGFAARCSAAFAPHPGECLLEGSLPRARVAGRDSHPLDDKQGFMKSSHTPFLLDQPCLAAPGIRRTALMSRICRTGRTTSRNRIRPPSEEIRPPSKSAVTFLRRTAGCTGKRGVLATNFDPMTTTHAMSARTTSCRTE